jgi:hypothetical protein
MGLKQFIEANSGTLLWVGSSCLLVVGNTVTTEANGDLSVTVASGLLGAPLEDIIYEATIRYQISTVPLEMAGLTARLFAVPIDVTDKVTT